MPFCVVQVAAVTVVGSTEGCSQVNWRVVATHVMWWFMGFFVLLLATYVLVAQGQALSWLIPAFYASLFHAGVQKARPAPFPPPLPPSPALHAVWHGCFFAVCAMFPAKAVYPTQSSLQSDRVSTRLCHSHKIVIALPLLTMITVGWTGACRSRNLHTMLKLLRNLTLCNSPINEVPSRGPYLGTSGNFLPCFAGLYAPSLETTGNLPG